MTRFADTSLHRRRLRIALRQARHRIGMTQHDAANALHWSLSKINRIEQGTFGTSVTDLRAMLALYDITDPVEVQALEDAARRSKGQVWWTSYRDITNASLESYLGYEQAAHELRLYHPVIIPELLQTEEYSTALAAPLESRQQQRLVELLTARQELVFEDSRARLHVVVDEAALHRRIGSRRVMQRQLQHLAQVSRLSQVDLSVLPFTAGAHLATTTGFTLLSFPDDTDLVRTEGSAARGLEEAVEEVAPYQDCFDQLTQRALRGAKALDAITAIERSSTG